MVTKILTLFFDSESLKILLLALDIAIDKKMFDTEEVDFDMLIMRLVSDFLAENLKEV